MEENFRKMKDEFEKAQQKVPFVDIVFCMPGHPSSGEQSVTQMNAITIMMAGATVAFRQATGAYVYAVRNDCLRGKRSKNGEMVKGQWKNQKPFENFCDYKYIVWNDSDNHIGAEMIKRLIAYDVDIVAAYYRTSTNMSIPDNEANASCGRWDALTWENQIPYKLGEIPSLPRNKKGLVEVDFTGWGLCAMKKGVFEALAYPWFRHKLMEWTDEDGEECAEMTTDDPEICQRIKAAGFKIYIDPTMRIIHEKRCKI